MKSELYTAAQGLIARQLELDTVTNNLANINTDGFRKTTPFFRTYNAALEEGPQNPLNGAANNQPVAGGVFIHSEQGALRQTGNDFDLAIEGDGYFKLNTPFGTRYTRNGQFTLKIAQDGAAAGTAHLANKNGYEVLDVAGNRITLNPQGGEMVVDHDGRVYQDGTEVAQIAMVTFNDKAGLVPEENTLLSSLDPTIQEVPVTPGETRLFQRTLETSNVNVAR